MATRLRRYIRRKLGLDSAQQISAPAVQKVEVQNKPKSPIDLAHEAAVRDSFEEFREPMAEALLFPQKGRLRGHALDMAMRNTGEDGLYLEFGVFRAEGLNFFARKLARKGLTITGFDSLRGLEEDWTGNHNGREAGAYSVKGKAPALEPNASLRAGWVQDTLPGFLEEHPGQDIAFAHMDFDTYTPTAFTLDLIKPRLMKGSILLFDELYGYPGWRHHEYKALKECLPDNCYRYVAFSREAVAVELTRDPDLT